MMNQRANRPVPKKFVELWNRIGSEPLPDFTRVIRGAYNLDEKRQLATLCFEAAGREWGGRFYLASTDAGTLAGIDQATAARWLHDFEKLRLICRVSAGNWTAGASHFVWVYSETAATRARKPRKRRPKSEIASTNPV